MVLRPTSPLAGAGLACALLLTACGGSSKGDPAQTRTPDRPAPVRNVQPQSLPLGFWAGDFRPADGGPTRPVGAMVLPDGVTFYSQGGIFQGTVARGQSRGTLTLFTPGTTQDDNRVVPATLRIVRVDEPRSFEISLDGNPHLRGTATLTRQDSAEQAMALRDLEGRWESNGSQNSSTELVTLQVGADGRITGQVDGHPVITGGSVRIPNDNRRLFTFTLTIQAPGEQAMAVQGVGRLERTADGQDNVILVGTGARRVFQGTFAR